MADLMRNLWKTRIKPLLSSIKWKSFDGLQWFRDQSARPIVAWLGGRSSALCRIFQTGQLTTQKVIAGYAQGMFATGKPNGAVQWHAPKIRGVIATDGVHVSKRLQTYVRKSSLEIRYNNDFDRVLSACADRQSTWITGPIATVYQDLHRMGLAHSVEAYQGEELVGGGYGVSLGQVFFLESMFCTEDHASKIAFVHLAEKLNREGFLWIDCQFLSEHWKRFGAKPMQRDELEHHIAESLVCPARFSNVPLPVENGGTSADSHEAPYGNEGFSGTDACPPLRAQLTVSCHAQPFVQE